MLLNETWWLCIVLWPPTLWSPPRIYSWAHPLFIKPSSPWFNLKETQHLISFLCRQLSDQPPLKRNDNSCLMPLLECLKDIKAWLALYFLNLYKGQTEVMMFPSSGTCYTPPMDLGFHQPHVRPMITNLGVIMDSDFELAKQINSVVKSSFCHLRLLSKIKSIL